VTLRTLLALGRVSNLPTVWTNVLAGAVLSGGRLSADVVLLLALAGSLLYVGGMFLNDAFDRAIDARMRPERPIPSGRATAGVVFAIGFGLLAAGIAGAALASAQAASGTGPEARPVAAAVVLAGLVVLYDAFHKGHPASVLVMAACRVMLFVLAAVTVGGLTPLAMVGAALVGAHVVGLSLIARKEASRPGWPQLVARLIAGICLIDALLIASQGLWLLGALAALGFPATLLAHRFVKGT
jgi:4-hydroxybenzoate polyprenyltransferase